MKFVDLEAQQRRIEGKIRGAIDRVLAHGEYIQGPEVFLFEQRLAEYTGAKYCISCGNGTDALQIALMALEIGVGDEVITPAFNYIAAAEAIKLLGATPVYADIDPVTYNISPAAIESLITERTKAIVPTSMFGQAANFSAINEIADSHGLSVIEDAAQSMGATYFGRKSGALSKIATTSFFPSKPLGGYGDGGAILTSDDTIAEVCRQIARHGQNGRYNHVRLGVNSRLDTIQAAILLEKLEILEDEKQRRARVADYYAARFGEIKKNTAIEIGLPTLADSCTSAFAQYAVTIFERERVLERINGRIPTAIHYPKPVFRQAAMFQAEIEAPFASQLAEQVLCLPMHPYLTSAEQDDVVASLVAALAPRPL